MNPSKYIVPLWVDGKEETTISKLEVVSPKTDKICWCASSANPGDAIKAVLAAQAAFPSWSQTKPATKQRILLKAADLLAERSEEYGGFMETEMGGERGPIHYWILPTAVKFLRDIAGRIPCISGTVPVCEDDGTSAMVWKQPYGVVLGIAPWNAPFALGMRAIATAIGTGNTTVLKGSELSPRCYWALGKVFHDAGLPAGVLNIIYCDSPKAEEVVSVMIEHPAVKKINFTGSTETGRKIARTCGQNLKPCLMELGGKNSAIVLADADLTKAVDSCIRGSFLHSGQICMSTGRIILHEAIASRFLEAIKAGLAAMASSSAGPPTLVSSKSRSRIRDLATAAIGDGALDLLVNTLAKTDITNAAPGGAACAPMLIGNVTTDMDLWNEEIFGPVVPYVIVKSDDEAVEMANHTQYGLSAAVFTQDLRKAFAIARRLDVGAVHINSMTVHDKPGLPHGGIKNSGWGRFNAENGLEEFLVTKTVTWND